MCTDNAPELLDADASINKMLHVVSQNHRAVEVGRDLWRLSSPNTGPVAQHCIQMAFQDL